MIMQLRKKHKRPTVQIEYPYGVFATYRFVEMEFEPRDELSDRVCQKKGTPHAKIIAKGKDDKREYFLHATKGYRSHVL
jgi:hypothetical protein